MSPSDPGPTLPPTDAGSSTGCAGPGPEALICTHRTRPGDNRTWHKAASLCCPPAQFSDGTARTAPEPDLRPQQDQAGPAGARCPAFGVPAAFIYAHLLITRK